MRRRLQSARRLTAAGLSAAVLAGCSSVQPTPTMPTYPAQVGGRYGVSAETDAGCRQQAYQAASTAKQNNVGKEVAFTAIGAIAGAAIGNALEPSGPRGPGPGGPGGPGGPRGHGGPALGGAGAVTGLATGAAMSQSTLQDPQQVYDITYNNCIETNRGYRR